MFPKIGGFPPKMDGENNGSKPYEQMDDLGGWGGVFPPIFGSTPHTASFCPYFFEFLSWTELHPSPSETWYKVCHPGV